MDRFRQLEVFAAVIEAGSFAQAAKRLRMSPPAVTRFVSALEDRLGAKLITRTTRSLSLTETGLRFLEQTRGVLADLDQAEREAVGDFSAPRGHLTITSSVSVGRIMLMPIIMEFLDAHPNVTASVIQVDRVVNLIEEGIDVGIRIGPLPDSQLIARRVGSVRRMLVAAPTYLERHGHPTHPKALKDHHLIGFTGLLPNRDWRYVENGRSFQISLTPRIEVNDASSAVTAAIGGYGIVPTISYMASDALSDGRLVPVLQPFWSAPAPAHIVFPQTRLLAPKTRAFVDHAAPKLQAAFAACDARLTAITQAA